MTAPTRRTVLRTAAGTLALALAGCTGDGGGDGDTISGSDYPAVDRWLTTTDVGGADDTYDGTLLDRRDRSELTIDVGAQGNGGPNAFGPSAVVVSTGTTVRWVWTGNGFHNVDAEADEQIGETDFEFTSGQPTGESGHEFTQTFDTAGIALYHCEPHLSLGMKGAIVVE